MHSAARAYRSRLRRNPAQWFPLGLCVLPHAGLGRGRQELIMQALDVVVGNRC